MVKESLATDPTQAYSFRGTIHPYQYFIIKSPIYRNRTALISCIADMSALNYIWPSKAEVTNEHVNEASEVIRAATSWANEVHLNVRTADLSFPNVPCHMRKRRS
jgi:hypothetical protein